MHETLEQIFHLVVDYGILIIEVIGAAMLVYAAVRGFIAIIRREPHATIELAAGISTALSFLLCGEALKTIIAPGWEELGKTAAVFLMRAAMSLLLHWEVTNKKKEI